MLRRVLSGLIALPLVYLCVQTPAAFAPLVAAMAAIGFRELSALARARGVETQQLLGTALAVVVALSPIVDPTPRADRQLGLVVIATLAVLSRSIVGQRPLEELLPTVATTLLGVLWLGLLGSYFLWLQVGFGPSFVYLLLLAVWGGDIGAFIIGTAMGSHRLAPRLSPKKSVEGLFGGIAGAIGGVVAGRWLFADVAAAIRPDRAVLLGLLLAVVGVVGDLVESAVKRGAGMKDSGALIPGHGGLLDRVDSLLFAAPVLYYYLQWFR